MKNLFESGRLLAPLMTHSCVVYTSVAVGGDRESKHFEEIVKYESLPCRISESSSSVPSARGDSANHTGSAKVYLMSGVKIAPGDILVVSAVGNSTRVEAVFSAEYETHVEISGRIIEEG